MTRIENGSYSPREVLLTSDELTDGVVLTRDVQIGNRTVVMQALTHIGGPNKDTNEDAGVVRVDGSSLYVVVVDGGTQVEPVPSLGSKKGGKYIAEQVVSSGQRVKTGGSAAQYLRNINVALAEDEAKNHPDIRHTLDSMNVPYGSIAAVRIDLVTNELEVANAGDVYVITTRDNYIHELLTNDTVYEKDQKTFQTTRKIAQSFDVTPRYIMEHIHDERFRPVLEEEYETMTLGNTGMIKRVTGSQWISVDMFYGRLEQIRSLLLFSDGAIPLDIDVHAQRSIEYLMALVEDSGLEGLFNDVRHSQIADPDFQRHIRFRDQDDFIAFQIHLH